MTAWRALDAAVEGFPLRDVLAGVLLDAAPVLEQPLLDEIDRLRAAITDAPHNADCATSRHVWRDGSATCDCWRAAALVGAGEDTTND